jgi:hypothetical protein
MRYARIFAAVIFATSIYATAPALAQQDGRQVPLVQRDFSDCSNADVSVRDPAIGGNVTVDRGADGNTHVRVTLAARPNTTYHFFLKCVRQLGDITTQGDGFAVANFDFPANSAGDVFAFDMYPEGAPLGNKFQSAQVNFRTVPTENAAITFLPPGQQITRGVPLVRRDFSDCANGDVSAQPPQPAGGNATVDRGADGNTHVRVVLTAQPNTTYHFFLKCVLQLGDVTTQANGVGIANFNFRTSSTGDVFAFDSYPEGAPLGNKFQSVQVDFRPPPPVIDPPTPPQIDPPPTDPNSPRVEYLDQNATRVSVAYERMPAGAEIVLMNWGGSSETPARAALDQGGSGTAAIPIDAQSSGKYYLLARRQADKSYICQTVAFYIN